MEMLSLVLSIISLIGAVISIILAIVSMNSSAEHERVSRENYDKTKDVLAQIDKKIEVIEKLNQEGYNKLQNTITNIVEKTVIPQKEDIGEKMGVEFLRSVMNNPKEGTEMLKNLAELKDTFEALGKNK